MDQASSADLAPSGARFTRQASARYRSQTTASITRQDFALRQGTATKRRKGAIASHHQVDETIGVQHWRDEAPRYFNFCSFCDRERAPNERFPNGPSASICTGCLSRCEDLLADRRRASVVSQTPRCGLCFPKDQGNVFVSAPGVFICQLCVERCSALVPSTLAPDPMAREDVKIVPLRLVTVRIA